MTAYKNHKHMEPKAELRHHMPLAALEHMLCNNQLRLTRVDRFDDPFEGSVPKKQIDDQLPAFSSWNMMQTMGESMAAHIPGAAVPPRLVNDPWTRMTLRRRAATRSAHAICWTEGPESEAMWRLYCEDGKRGQGVALRSTFGKLEASIAHHDLIIGRVVYRLYHEGTAFDDELDPFMHKRKGFECEREVRVLSYNRQHCSALAWSLIGGDGYVPAQDPPLELPEHIFFDWHPLDVADSIVISPYATEDYERRVRRAVSSIEPAALALVELSILSERRHAANF